MLTQKEIEQHTLLKGAYCEPDNRPEWAFYWLRELVENIEEAKCNNPNCQTAMFVEKQVLESWFEAFWKHYQECQAFEEMTREQDQIGLLSLEDLRLQFVEE